MPTQAWVNGNKWSPQGATTANIETALAAEFELLERGTTRAKEAADEVVARVLFDGNPDSELGFLETRFLLVRILVSRAINRAVQIGTSFGLLLRIPPSLPSVSPSLVPPSHFLLKSQYAHQTATFPRFQFFWWDGTSGGRLGRACVGER